MTASALLDPMLPRPYRIRRVRRETPDTFTLELERATASIGAGVHASRGAEELGSRGARGQRGRRAEEASGLLSSSPSPPFPGSPAPLSLSTAAPPLSFLPGQFNMLYVFGVGEVPISISGDPAEAHTLAHTVRGVGTVTKAMRKLTRGDVLGVRGPFGNPWPTEEAIGSDVVIVAGGIGLAPLRPVLYRMLSQREKYGKIVLLYGARTPEDILYRRELERWRARFDLNVDVTVDRATGGWRGNVGVVTTLISKAPFDPLQTVAMVCGPEVMMRFTVIELQKRGVQLENIFLSMERNMKCGVGFCGHCQFGPTFVCKDGPVFRYTRIKELLAKWEI